MASQKKFAQLVAAIAGETGKHEGKLMEAAAALASQGRKVDRAALVAEYNRIAGVPGAVDFGKPQVRMAAEMQDPRRGRQPVPLEQHMGPEGHVGQTVSSFSPELAARVARGEISPEDLMAIYRAGPPPPPTPGPNPLGSHVDGVLQRLAEQRGAQASIANQFDAARGRAFDTGPGAPASFSVRTDPFYMSQPTSRPYSAIEDDALNFRPLHGGRTVMDTGPAADAAFSVRTDPFYMSPPSMGGVFDTGPAARPVIETSTGPLFRSAPAERPNTLDNMLDRLRGQSLTGAVPTHENQVMFQIRDSDAAVRARARAGVPDARTSVGADAMVGNLAPPDAQPFFELRGGVRPGGDLSAAQMADAMASHHPAATVMDVLQPGRGVGEGVEVLNRPARQVVTQADVLGPVRQIDATNPTAPRVTDTFVGGGMPTAMRGPGARRRNFVERNPRATAYGGIAAGVGALMGAQALYRARQPGYEEPLPDEVADDLPPDPLEAAAVPMVMEDEAPVEMAAAEPVMEGAPELTPEEVDAEVMGWQAENERAEQELDAGLEAAAAEIAPDPDPVTPPGDRRMRQLLYQARNQMRKERNGRTTPPSAAALARRLAVEYPERFAGTTEDEIAEVDRLIQGDARAARERQMAARFAAGQPGPWWARNQAGQLMAQQFMDMDPDNQQAMMLEMNTAPDIEQVWNPRTNSFQYKVTRRGQTPNDIRTLARAQQAEAGEKQADRDNQRAIAQMNADTQMGVEGVRAGAADRAGERTAATAAEQIAVDRERIQQAAATAAAQLAQAQAEGDARRAQEMEVKLLDLEREDRRLANEEEKTRVTAEGAAAQRPPTPAEAARSMGDAEAAGLEREVEAKAGELRKNRYTRARAYGALRADPKFRVLRPNEIQSALNAAGFPPQ